MQRPFHRLAIVNRGDPAMRLVHTVRELNEERDHAIRTIALHTEPERHAMFVREADEAWCIGPATIVDPTDGERKNGYLDLRALERALVASGADAAWVGWGFVAERPAFVELCDRLGIVFVGPDADVMRALGDKIGAKRIAEQAGVPVAPWSGGPVETLATARAAADAIGYPLMIKAAAGGGGRGIRRVSHPDDLEALFDSARAEARLAFGDPTVFVEQLVTPARHVEVQVIADGQGTVWAAGVRDCTLQRRNQKVVEESASPALTDAQDHEAREAACRLARVAGYRGAATVEFLYRPDTRALSFLEVNTRLQVEHPVTEVTTGVDLVRLQLHVAAGGRLEGPPPPPPAGHAIEVRLNAEDPEHDFAPAPGTVRLLRLPTGPGLRVDTGIAEGDAIPPEFDSMIAKIVAWGHDRDAALARLRRALAETVVVVAGGTTNQGFLLDLLARPEVRSSDVDNTWLDRLAAAGELAPARHAELALVMAAIDAYDAVSALEQQRFYAWARRGRPQARPELGATIDLAHRGARYRLLVWRMSREHYRVELDGIAVDAVVERLSEFESRLHCCGTVRKVVSTTEGADHVVTVDGVAHRLSRDDGGLVRSPAPAVVVSVSVKAGDEVAAGDAIAIVESMKMEVAVRAPFAGRVREVLVGTNVQVDSATPLVRLDPLDAHSDSSPETRLHLGGLADPVEHADTVAERCRADFGALEALVLGWDVPDSEHRRAQDDLRELCARAGPDVPEVLAGERRVLRAFADLRRLTRRRHDTGDADTDLGQSPQEYLHAYLRSLDAELEGLPPRYVEQLRRAVEHYGVASLERSSALEEALYRVFRSQQRIGPQVGAVTSILDRRLEFADQLVGRDDAELREVLEGLIEATRWRDPTIADLAREVRFRWFDQPLLEQARDAVNDALEEHLAALAADPHGPTRDEHLAALVDWPQSIAAALGARLGTADAPQREALLEALTRRYYRMRTLELLTPCTRDGRPCLSAEYDFEGRRFHVLGTHLDLVELPDVAATVATTAAELPAGSALVVDLYARDTATSSDPDDVAATLREQLEAARVGPAVHRIAVGITRAPHGSTVPTMEAYTFRRRAGGRLVEDRPVRGLHPMMAERLHFWRLANFELERLPAAEDVYLFRGVAHANPRDERLFAIAEVRDLTPIRDESGHIVALPQLERLLVASLDGIRRFQARRPPEERLQWNRVLLHVWPPIDLDLTEIRAMLPGLASPATGLGIESVLVSARMPDGPGAELRERVLRISNPAGGGVVVQVDDQPTEPLQPLDDYSQKVVQARRRGTVYPYELVRTLAPRSVDATADLPGGEFVELELEGSGLAPVGRPPGHNQAGIVVGLVRNFTDRYPEGMTRVALLGDPTRALGAIAEPECRRIIAALDLAEELRVPVEWFALSAGAKIAMDSGTENMDWIAAVLRRLVEFTQRGGEVNVVVCGINVGAQPYWNAEATMLLHTRGILVMTPDSAMVLTGKQALDYSGGVSAEDNFGIGGYERIMGPNGQAQYWAPDLAAACGVLLRHYDHAYVAPGERFPRRAHTADPTDRDVGPSPHHGEGSEFGTVGEIFSEVTNPGRKKPFDIRSVMRAVIDADHEPLERWHGMRDAETVVVWDAHLGGWPVALLGIESRPLSRWGPIPADGPEDWTPGTLFPLSSKKAARAINAASGGRPLVVLANLSGFDGSPESMRSLQLEFGAEIGRAIVNFDGPVVFCVISRYHGGAFVVFSTRLNDRIEAAALEGSHASVIGGAPAAAVVFPHEVDVRARNDPRVADLEARIESAEGAERSGLRAELAGVWEAVRSEKLGAVAAEFDAIHSVERAQRVGSVHRIIPARELRPYLAGAVERGIRAVLDDEARAGEG